MTEDEVQPELATLFTNREKSSDYEQMEENKGLLDSMFYSKWHLIEYRVKNSKVDPRKYKANQDNIYRQDIGI